MGSNDGFGTPTAPREVVRWTLPIFSKLCSRGLSRGSLLAYRMAMSRDLADRPLQSARGRLGWGIFALHAMAGVTCNAHTARLHVVCMPCLWFALATVCLGSDRAEERSCLAC